MSTYKLAYAQPNDPTIEIYKKILGEKAVALQRIEWPPTKVVKQIRDHEMWHNLTIWSPVSMMNAGHVRVGDSHAGVVLIPKSGSDEALYAVLKYFGGPKGKTIEYYELAACEHEYVHSSGGNCYHIYTCKHCGHRYDVDSSD